MICAYIIIGLILSFFLIEQCDSVLECFVVGMLWLPILCFMIVETKEFQQVGAKFKKIIFPVKKKEDDQKTEP